MKRNKYNYDCLVRISSDLAILLSSGISVINAFKIVSASVTNKQYKKALNEIVNEIHSGTSLGEAFSKFENFFPELFIQMIFVGEASGNIVVVLEELSSFYTIKKDIKKKIINISVYPLILIGTLIIMLGFYVEVIAPAVGEFIQGTESKIPWYTSKILSICNFIRENTTVVLLSLICWGVGIIVLIYMLLKNKKISKEVKNIKFFRNFREVLEIEALLLMIKCGVPLARGLEILIDIFSTEGSGYCFSEIMTYINNGVSLSEAFYNTGSFSELSLNLISIGEESGRLEYSLDKLKIMLTKNLQKNMEWLTTLLQPILILAIGVLICFLILIMLVPIYSGMGV